MNDLKDRTKKFAIDCFKLVVKFPNTFMGKHCASQLFRSSSSVAANYRASQLSQTKAVFISKLSIVIEEADESEFWLEFSEEIGVVRGNEVKRLIREAEELTSIFVKARKTAQTKK
jgi:four helix bundle protein